MNLPRSERDKHLDVWRQFVIAAETNDCVTIQGMREKFNGQHLGTALALAAEFNSVDVLSELLTHPCQGILMYVHDALMKAAERGHVQSLEIVLPHTDPKRKGVFNLALWSALVHNHPPCVEILFDWIEVDEVLRIAHERRAKPNAAFGAFEQRVAERQRAVLTDTIEPRGQARGTRKI